MEILFTNRQFVTRLLFRFICLSTFFSLFLACKFFKNSNESSLKYGIAPEDDLEFLKKVLDTGTVEVCIKIEKNSLGVMSKNNLFSKDAISFLPREFKKPLLRSAVETALNSWNEVFLSADPVDWPHKKLKIVTLFEPECSIENHLISDKSTVAKANIDVKFESQRATAYFEALTINIHISNVLDKYVLAHEFGHLFGLADLYEEDFKNDSPPLPGQPKTLMSDPNAGFTSDEVAAAITLLEYLKTNELACAKGYKPYSYSKAEYMVHPASAGSLFCIKEGSQLRDSYIIVSSLEDESIAKSKRHFFENKIKSHFISCKSSTQKDVELRFSNPDPKGTPQSLKFWVVQQGHAETETSFESFRIENSPTVTTIKSKGFAARFHFTVKRLLDDMGKYFRDKNGRIEGLSFDNFQGLFEKRESNGVVSPLIQDDFDCHFTPNKSN